jgi:hypothetical protein
MARELDGNIASTEHALVLIGTAKTAGDVSAAVRSTHPFHSGDVASNVFLALVRPLFAAKL